MRRLHHKTYLDPRVRAESGQGVIEYILILLISVIIIGSLIYQFNSAFRSYAEAFFGGYISCLLELGEIPGAAAGACQFDSFDLKNGKKVIKDGNFGSMGSSSSKGSSSSSDSSTSNSKKSSSQNSRSSGDSPRDSSADGEGDTTNSGSPGLQAGRTPIGRFKDAHKASTPVGSVDAEGGKKEKKKDSGSKNARRQVLTPTSGEVTGSKEKTSLTNVTYWGYEEAQEREEERPSVASASKNFSNEKDLRAKTAKLNSSTKESTPQKEIKTDGFTFGQILRYLVIAGIVIAIFVFFGGQALQISKSWEK